MSTVYAARDGALGRVVALKVLSSSLARSTPDAIERFKSEAQIIAQLKHPNIVPVFDFGHEGDITYFVTPLLSGETLASRIKLGSFSGSEVRRILLPIAAAIDYAHLCGIVHRDVKPSNIMLDREGNSHLMDFGIAQAPEPDREFTPTGTTVGTIMYMAPEAIQGQAVDHSVDIYALGLVAFEMLAGRPAFKASNSLAVVQAIMEGKSLSLATICPEVPKRTAEAVHRAFARNKSDRYIFASEFIEAAFPASEFAEPADDVTRIFDRFIAVSATDTQPKAPEPPPAPAAATSPAAAGTGAAPARAEEDWSEFERLFGLVPKPAEARPASAQAALAPDATQVFFTVPPEPRREAPDVGVSALTGVFPVVPASESKTEPPSPDAPFPDVCLSISRCADAVYIGRKVSVGRFPFRIGRSAEDFRVSFDRAISAEHVEINYSDGCFTIRDLGSANGTFVKWKEAARAAGRTSSLRLARPARIEHRVRIRLQRSH
jgi:serine/threonine-protein kinase